MDSDDEMSALEWVVCILCSGIGCILGIVYLVQGKPKGGMVLGVSIGAAIVWTLVRFGLQALQNQ